MTLTRPLYFASRTLRGLISRRSGFTYIYRRRGWGEAESVTTDAFSLAQTRAIREALPGVLREIGARTLLDVPCGDCHWIRHTDLDLDR
jgi:hypothetical protein